MELDDKDGGNSISSKDVDKRPIESVEPSKEKEELFIPLELQNIDL